MKLFSRTLRELRTAPTLTEQLYIVSPLLLAALKDLSEFAGLAARRNRRIVERMATEVSERNSDLADKSEELLVVNGPFRGMRYIKSSAGSLLKAKVIGTYENEIGMWFQDAISSSIHDLFIDVGCAEGYYAVGMARSCPAISVHGFDIDPIAQKMTRELARLNLVEDRVEVSGKCTPKFLQELLNAARTPLMLVDIEGYEDELLDLEVCPALARADVIVELHEHKRPGLTYRILERFKGTHKIDAAVSVPDQWKLNEAAKSPETADRAITIVDVQEGRRLPQMWLRMRSQVS